MSRPSKAVVDYFPHYVNHGKTMFTIESRYGNDGYAFWFKLLELLGASEQHYIDCNNAESWEFMLAKTRVSEEIAVEILGLLSKLGAVDKELWAHKIIRSDNFINNLSTVYKRRDVDVLTNSDVMGLCKQKLRVSEVNVNNNPQRKEKKSKGKESKEKNAFEIAVDDFIEFRKKIRKPMTERAIELLIEKLDKLASDDETKISILNQSILKGWQGVFPLAQEYKTQTQPEQKKSAKQILAEESDRILREEGAI